MYKLLRRSAGGSNNGAVPGHRVGRRWMFKQDEVDECARSDGAAEPAESGKERKAEASPHL